MEFLMLAVGWYFVGVIGNALMLGVWWREDLDVDVSDLIFAAFMSLAGPIALCSGALLAATTMIRRLARRVGIHGDTVVWSRRA